MVGFMADFEADVARPHGVAALAAPIGNSQVFSFGSSSQSTYSYTFIASQSGNYGFRLVGVGGQGTADTSNVTNGGGSGAFVYKRVRMNAGQTAQVTIASTGTTVSVAGLTLSAASGSASGGGAASGGDLNINGSAGNGSNGGGTNGGKGGTYQPANNGAYGGGGAPGDAVLPGGNGGNGGYGGNGGFPGGGGGGNVGNGNWPGGPGVCLVIYEGP